MVTEHLGLIFSFLSIAVAFGLCYYQIRKNRQLTLLNETIKRMEIMSSIAIESLKDSQISYETYFLHQQIVEASLIEFLDASARNEEGWRVWCKLRKYYIHQYDLKLNILNDYKRWVEYCELNTRIESRRQSFSRQQRSVISKEICIQLSDIIKRLLLIK